MYGYTYMEVFSCNLEPRFTFLYLYLLGWAEMHFSAGTLTTKRVARLVTNILREHMYATAYVVRNYFF